MGYRRMHCRVTLRDVWGQLWPWKMYAWKSQRACNTGRASLPRERRRWSDASGSCWEQQHCWCGSTATWVFDVLHTAISNEKSHLFLSEDHNIGPLVKVTFCWLRREKHLLVVKDVPLRVMEVWTVQYPLAPTIHTVEVVEKGILGLEKWLFIHIQVFVCRFQKDQWCLRNISHQGAIVVGAKNCLAQSGMFELELKVRCVV